MAELIARVRLLIGDPASATQQFSDQQVQDALDRYREDVRYLELIEQPTFETAPTSTAWLDYYADRGDWESDAVLYKSDWSALTPATSDYLTGHWTFSSTQYPPVFIVGKCYDVHMAGAELAETWAATYARAYAFSADGATFNRNQAAEGLRALAMDLRRKAKPRVASLVRSDVNLGWW